MMRKNINRKSLIRKTLINFGGFALAAWLAFGILSPEMFWNADVCKSCEQECLSGEELLDAVLSAKPGEIKGHSRLMELWQAFWKKDRKVSDKGMEQKLTADAPIGVFDSGVGGLTVAREIMRQIPNERSYILGTRRECLTAASRRRP